MNFSRFLDIQSWWEVPSIAYFCSLFRTAFNLLDFDIEELEEALLTDGTEESASSLLTELIVRLLNGCLGNNDISAFNYQMYLRRLFRRKCQETGRYNPFNTDIDFQFLPLRTKVEILYALCDFRLDAEDVFDLFKNLEAESLRVEPLGWDDNYSAYWYFYGTRLYREDIIRKPKGKNKKKRPRDSRKRSWYYGDEWLDEEETERVWQVVCFTEEDWAHLTDKFSKATSKVEKELYRSLSQNFLPEIPRLFQEKERLQRKRLLELAPRRTSNRVLKKIKQKEEETKQSTDDNKDEEDERKETPELARENRAKRRNLLRSKSVSSDTSDSSQSAKEEMPQKVAKRSKSQDKRSKNSSATHKGEPPPELPVKTGRKTNNSLASATGQILIPDNDEPINSTRKKLKTSQIFSQSEEDIQTDMYKVLEQITAHEDAWPFIDPVEEEYAPNYYAVIRRPMDLRKMEERLDNGYYSDFTMFKADFKLIVNNCRLYNGQDNEYTMMVDNLQLAFDRLTEKYMHRISSSDEEIAVEYQIPTPSRKHKLKPSESPIPHKRKKRKSHTENELKSSSSDVVQEDKKQDKKQNDDDEPPEFEEKKTKESHKLKQSKGKKKRRGHHRHGKHSKNHKKQHDSKSKHKKKHDKKDKDKNKQKKKKSKHHEVEEVAVKCEARADTLDSVESSRSASPLPSIHTPSPSPSPTPSDAEPSPNDQLNDPDFFKDKYDKIKERRRHAAKEAWDSLVEHKHRSDKHKHHSERDRNPKLRETIEKLKAKHERYKENTMFKNLYSGSQDGEDTSDSKTTEKESSKKDDDSDDEPLEKDKDRDKDKDKPLKKPKKGHKKNFAKNESASEALEEAVKDISKWLDETPKGSNISSPCDSPAQTISTEEQENSRQDDELSQSDKSVYSKKEFTRKRPSSREPKVIKRREIQRTIDRLQPGKSKGNLLTNISNKNTEKVEESAAAGTVSKVRESAKAEESSPKLSLGSVLPTVEFTLGKDHKFDNKEATTETPKEVVKEQEVEKKENEKKEAPSVEKKPEETVSIAKKDAEVETEPQIVTKPNQEKATPNLSAWFKAFGAPKSTPPTTSTIKKKSEETDTDEKSQEPSHPDSKAISPKNPVKYDSPNDPDPTADGGDSPLPNVNATPRQRRTSTGSSVSERSSFSQDLDSPRHQMSHTSPLLHSPASPRTDDFQKITYPIINGTVRAGFYQDTTSIKSSPEKSCSPREAPQSPFSPYSPHVYATNNAGGSATPNYFVDHNKSPLPTYTQNPPPYYDTTKAAAASKQTRAHEDYTSLGPETFQQSPYARPYSPAYSPYHQTPTTYSQIQHSPQPTPVSMPPTLPSNAADMKTTHFPVKKRMYNEPDQPALLSPTKMPENKEPTIPQNKIEYSKPLHTMPQMSNTSVDNIALALSEKSELAKLREKSTIDYANDRLHEQRDKPKVDHIETAHEQKKDTVPNDSVPPKPMGMIQKDGIDMVNMGYMNPEIDRRNSGELHDADYSVVRDMPKPPVNTQPKIYDIDAIALNLGMNNQPMQKNLAKTTVANVQPAHSQERIPPPPVHEHRGDMNINQNAAHINQTAAHINQTAAHMNQTTAHMNQTTAHMNQTTAHMNQTAAHSHHPNQYDHLNAGQSISNFSISDIELANKKLYSCNATPSSAAIDYIKLANQMRKQEMMPSDYSTQYNVSSAEKLKNEMNTVNNSNAINYNKNIQHQQYNMYNVPRPSTAQRAQELQQHPSELRIPNPRGMMKNDHMSVPSSLSDHDTTNKNIENVVKNQKPEKLVQNHPLVTSNPYKTPYSTPSLPLETLRNIPNIPQMLERYGNDERFLSSYASSSSSLYHEKQYQMAQIFNKSISSDLPPSSSTSSSIYSQSSSSMNKDTSIYKLPNIASQPSDPKTKPKRKRTVESKPAQIVGTQSYHATPCTSDVLSSVKSGMMPATAFNFGTSANMGLSSGLYGDNAGFSPNSLMAANYMVAAVAHQQQQRNNVDSNADKMAKPAHQNSSHSTSSFPFMGHGQVRGAYPFVGTDPSSPLYQQYLQRHQEELLRQTGAQIMSLYPGGYPASLGARQPYDSINMNRHSWL